MIKQKRVANINFYMYTANNYATITYFSIRNCDGTYSKFVKCKFWKGSTNPENKWLHNLKEHKKATQ